MRRYSTEYRNLQPYVVAEIRKIIDGSSRGGGSGAASGVVAAHRIDDLSKHTGQLSQGQAPWAATKSEFATHAADANAHHARAHGILSSGDHTVTGSQYQIVGLPSANTLGLLTSSTNPGASAAIVRTDNAGQTTLRTLEVTGSLYVDDVLDFGTNTMYEDATYLQVAGTKHLNFGQTIRSGSAWAMTTGGALSAAAAAFNGSVDVLNGGDLYVAGSGFYAGNPVLFADSSGGNVGILRVPDPQFALDVNGPARAQYFIGPHAIQLKDALLIAHYDGPERGPSGEPNGHMGQTATITGDVVFRPGKFGKAAEITDDYTNLLANPSFEANTTGWTAYATGSATTTRARVADEAWDGYYSYRIAKTGGANGDRSGAYTTFAVTSGLTYAVSVRVKLTAAVNGAGAMVTLRAETNVTGTQASVAAVTGEWVELAFTTVATATGTANLYVWLANCDTGTVYVDAVQVTATAAVRPYYTGARAAGSLTYANQPVTWSRFTAMTWYRVEDFASVRATNARLFELYGDGNNRVVIWLASSNDRLTVAHVQAGASVSVAATTAPSVREWHHAALVVNGTALALYLDGVQAVTGTVTNIAAGAATVYVGLYNGGERLNGMIDDFGIVNRALTANDIRAVYESNAPVFAESSTWNWRATPRGLVWADDEGLWMRDVGGNPVLGVYGGEAATKSWGGFALEVGDLVIGRNTAGSSAMMWDQSTGKFGFYGAGGSTPQVEIGTDGRITAINGDFSGAITATSGSIAGLLTIGTSGEIRQGTGTWGTNWTGLRIWNASGVGRIGGYNGSVLQWYADTDGSLRAGAGAVRLNNEGISVNVGTAATPANSYSFRHPTYSIDGGVVAYASGTTIINLDFYMGAANFNTVEVATYATNSKTNGVARAMMGASAGVSSGGVAVVAGVAALDRSSFDIDTEELHLNLLPTSAAAVGTYAGKVQIYINGAFRWIPYYSS